MGIVNFIKENGTREIKFFQQIYSWATNGLLKFVAFIFNQLLLQVVTPYIGNIQEKITDIRDKVKALPNKVKKIVDTIDKLIKMFKAIGKAAIQFVKVFAQVFLNFASPVTWVAWGIVLIVLILMFFSMLFGRFGTFQGELVLDFDKMQELNQDESQYTDLLNTAALRESFYDSVADTSFYQTFNLTDMNGGNIDLVSSITLNIAELLTGDSYTAEDFYASKKCTDNDSASCVYASGNINKVLSQAGLYVPQLDNRYQVTDASMNPAKYLMQAESLGVYSDSYGLTSYFRDYWNREENFSLSADFLYELNRWIYQTDAYPTTEQIVYPETFVQPVSFVNDYLRIQTDKKSSGFGKSYVYVTERVTLQDIEEAGNEFEGMYEYEGLIKSTPSDIVYDYAVVKKNLDEVADSMEETESQNSVNMGNPAKYMTYDDVIEYEGMELDQTEKLVRLYWIVNPYYMDLHMANAESDVSSWTPPADIPEKGIESNYYTIIDNQRTKLVLSKEDLSKPFIGPFYGFEADSDNGITLFNRLGNGVILAKSKQANSGQYEITAYYSRGENDLPQNCVEYATIENNMYPTRHYQLAQLTDEFGNIIVSSRNLINKTYLKTKTVRSSYRHSDDYWLGFEEFVNDDLDKTWYIGVISSAIGFHQMDACYKDIATNKMYYCPAGSTDREGCVEESEIYSEQKCSVVSYYSQNSISEDLVVKLLNFFQGENAELEVDAEAVYHILREYENHIMENGTEGVEWEYKYYTHSEAEAEKQAAEFANVTQNIGLWDISTVSGLLGISGIKRWFETDEDKYKDTFDAVVELNESRAISSEYTPIAVVSSDTASKVPGNVKIPNGSTWGWKLVDDGNGGYIIRVTYGETSLEFPDYYHNDGKLDESLQTLSYIKIFGELIAGSTPEKALKESISDSGKDLIHFFFKTDYAENIYGKTNFAYSWEIDPSTGEYTLVYDSETLNSFYSALILGTGSLPTLGSSDETYMQDIRNSEQAWNSHVDVWRPGYTNNGETEIQMVKCDPSTSQCGRVTTQTDPDDYYAMELKSVRDYGLASVLSYIEGRKVTFISALAVTETFDDAGAKRWFETYYGNCGLTGSELKNTVDLAMKGFYPVSLLEESVTIDGYTAYLADYVKSKRLVDDEGSSLITDILTPTDLNKIAEGLNRLQGTGNSILEYQNQYGKMRFTVSYSTEANDAFMGESNVNGLNLNYGGYVLVIDLWDGSKNDWENEWQFTNINVAFPYITQQGLISALGEDVWKEIVLPLLKVKDESKEYTTEDALKEAGNQFFNPLANYLKWFDHNSGAEDDVFSSIGNFLEGEHLISEYNNHTAQRLAEALGKVKANSVGYSLKDISSETELFGSAGTYTSDAIWVKLQHEYGEHVNPISLIDQSKTGQLYLIEEAVTFLGNFVYTYDTQLLLVGDIYGNEKIVSDLVFANRYYDVNHYMFAVPVYTTELVWSEEYVESFELLINPSNGSDIEDYYTSIYENNPCFDSNKRNEGANEDENIFEKVAGYLSDMIASAVDKIYTVAADWNIIEDERDQALGKYCASNFSYRFTDRYSIKYLKAKAPNIQMGQMACTPKNTTNNFTTSGQTVECEPYKNIAGNTLYRVITTNYVPATQVIELDLVQDPTEEAVSDAVNAWAQQNSYHLIDYAQGESVLHYNWHTKYGYTSRAGAVSNQSMVFVDTKEEVQAVYDRLNENGQSETAEKLFINYRVYAKDDSLISKNAKLPFLHDAAKNPTNPHFYDDEPYESMYGWCATPKNETNTQCKSAAYGDSDWHYLPYSNELLKNDGDLDLFSRYEAWVQTIPAIIGKDTSDLTSYIDEIEGYPYAVADGDDQLIDVPVNTSKENIVEFNKNDLVNIAQAIYDVFHLDYESYGANTSIAGSTAISGALLTLGEGEQGFEWATVVHGKDSSLVPSKEVQLIEVMKEGDTQKCVLNYVWPVGSFPVLKGDGSGFFNQDNASIRDRENTTSYSYYYSTSIMVSTLLSNDWKFLMTGLNVTLREEYGTPVILETYLYGNRRQISPILTGSYFNEEVYSDWVRRMNVEDALDEAFVLDYSLATSNYLYDYVTNFETYIPLGVMSDADLTARGADAYTSIGTNAQRAFTYTADYVSHIKQYLNTPGWKTILENYRTEPATILGSIKLGFTSEEVVDEDTMAAYIAGVIEASFVYAPTYMLEAFILDDNRIENSRENYEAILNAMYETTINNNDQARVRLATENGSTVEKPLLFLGPCAVYGDAATSKGAITTDAFASDVPGFGTVTLTLNNRVDERFDLEKSIEFVTVHFGKLLYKYGNVSAATMAYFYGESYWERLIEVARAEGISTGPEWHNDDPELISSAVETTSTTGWHVKTFKNSINDDEVLSKVFTASVVDYALSFVPDSSERIFLIQNATTALGSAAFAVGSLAEETRKVYDMLTDGVSVYFGTFVNDDKYVVDEDPIFIKMDYLADYARMFDVDLGALMAVIMGTSEGVPVYGLGEYSFDDADNGFYINSIILTDDADMRIGLFGLPVLPEKELTYSKSGTDYAENVKIYGELCASINETIGENGKCEFESRAIEGNSDAMSYSISMNIGINTDTTIDISDTYMRSLKISGLLADLNNENILPWYREEVEAQLDNALQYLTADARLGLGSYSDGEITSRSYNPTGLLYVLSRLSSIYEKTDGDTLETLYIYFYGEESLAQTKELAYDEGFGSNWYAYYCESVNHDSGDILIKSLNHYDTTLEEDNVVSVTVKSTSANAKTELSTADLTGRTVVDFFFDETYRRNVTQTKSYVSCEVTISGTCTRTKKTSDSFYSKNMAACSRDAVNKYLAGKEYESVSINGFPKYNTTHETIDSRTYVLTLKTISVDAYEELFDNLKNNVGKEIEDSLMSTFGLDSTVVVDEAKNKASRLVTYESLKLKFGTDEGSINGGYDDPNGPDYSSRATCYFLNAGSTDFVFGYNDGQYMVDMAKVVIGNSIMGINIETKKMEEFTWDVVAEIFMRYLRSTSFLQANYGYDPSKPENERHSYVCTASFRYAGEVKNSFDVETYSIPEAISADLNEGETKNDKFANYYFVDPLKKEDDGIYTVINEEDFIKVLQEQYTLNEEHEDLNNVSLITKRDTVTFDTDVAYGTSTTIGQYERIASRSQYEGLTVYVRVENDARYVNSSSSLLPGENPEIFDPDTTTLTPFESWYVKNTSYFTAMKTNALSSWKTHGRCSFTYTYTESKENVAQKDCSCEDGSCSFTPTSTDEEGLYLCKYDLTTEVHSGNEWELSADGFAMSAFALFGDTSAYNEYVEDTVSMQNSGILVYDNAPATSRNDVDVIITATFATESKWSLSAADYSIFAFFQKYDNYADDSARSWFSPNGLLSDGKGTINETAKNEFWDFPSLFRLYTNPTNRNSRVKDVNIVESFGYNYDPVGGGQKHLNGIKIGLTAGSNVYSVIGGRITAVGYNVSIGNYVEIENSKPNGESIILSSLNGDRYQVTGVKVIYGHLDKVNLAVNTTVSNGANLGTLGNSGTTLGDRLYLAIYIKCEKLDKADNMIGSTGWLPVDPEKYFNASWGN